MRPDVDISTTSNRDCQNLFAEMYLHTRLSRILLPRSFASALERRTVNIISHLRAETQTKLSALASDLPTLKVNVFYATPKAFPVRSEAPELSPLSRWTSPILSMPFRNSTPPPPVDHVPGDYHCNGYGEENIDAHERKRARPKAPKGNQ
ncbi:MAG TPA: hypothetical protein VG324_19420 [Blastocatellia bacterium]|nr:hypothetical protein [Blastocatellia bacterium]